MRKAAYILLVLLTVSCREWETPAFDDYAPEPNITIGDLRNAFDGNNVATITDDIVIAGRVVSSDRAGNFYNTFFIDDGTGATEIMAGMADLAATYIPGQTVAVRLRGLAVGWRDGVMQTGLPPEPGNRFATGYFYHPAVIRNHVFRRHDVEPVIPVELLPAEFSPALCGRLVRIPGLYRSSLDPLSTDGTWASTQPSPATGYVKFRSSPVDSITVTTSGYATFALAPIPSPSETVALTGLLFYGRGNGSKEHYLLKLRDENDIDF